MCTHSERPSSRAISTKRIKEDRSSGIHSGVNGTPNFFINGARFDGPADYDSLMEVIEEQLVND